MPGIWRTRYSGTLLPGDTSTAGTLEITCRYLGRGHNSGTPSKDIRVVGKHPSTYSVLWRYCNLVIHGGTHPVFYQVHACGYKSMHKSEKDTAISLPPESERDTRNQNSQDDLPISGYQPRGHPSGASCPTSLHDNASETAARPTQGIQILHRKSLPRGVRV